MKGKSLNKILLYVGIGIVAVVIIAVLAVTIFGDSALKSGIETVASNTLKVGVTLDKASLSILAGKLELKNLVIDNPPDYQHPNMLRLGQAAVDVKVGSLLGDTVEIDTIKLDGIDLYIEQKGLSSNLQDIINSLPPSEPKGGEKPAEPSEKGKDLLINELEISNVSVNVKLLPIPGKSDTVKLKLAPIKMTDIGKGGKISTAELITKVITALAVGVAEQGAGLLPTEMLGSLKDSLVKHGAQLFEGSKQVLDKTQEIGAGIIEGGKDIGKDATDALKGLFEKKEE